MENTAENTLKQKLWNSVIPKLRDTLKDKITIFGTGGEVPPESNWFNDVWKESERPYVEQKKDDLKT
jgi:hypothetical protein